MMYWLAELSQDFGAFNLFRYITVRAGAAFFTALVFGFVFGKPLIDFLRRRQGKGQPIREDGPESHLLTKKGTPTMGGLLILMPLTFSTLLWARLDNAYVWLVLGVTLSFGAIGFADDFAKVSKFSHDGLSGRFRLAVGFLIATLAALAAMYLHPESLEGRLAFPVFKEYLLDLGWLFIPFAAFVIVGSANAVNLTDGLDGLAIMPVMIAAGTLGVIAYAVGRVDFTSYLEVNYVPGTGELLIFTAALGGGGLGFLWYNAPPAAVFMGDTGSQARDRAGHRRRVVRGRGAERDYPGRLFQVDRAARVSDGADPPSFRKTGLGRAADCHPVLDHFGGSGADRTGDAENSLKSA